MPDEDLRALERAIATDPTAWARLRAERARREKFERSVRADAAWDRVSTGRGRHGMELHFVLRGPAGAVSLNVMTGWAPEPTTPPERGQPFMPIRAAHNPLPAGLITHHPVEVPEGDVHEECPALGGAKCWAHVTGIHAFDAFNLLVREGSDRLWKFLEEEYAMTFEGKYQCEEAVSDAR